jgi:hypothetical protein
MSIEVEAVHQITDELLGVLILCIRRGPVSMFRVRSGRPGSATGLDAPSRLVTRGPHRGHIRATTTGSQRTTSVTTGPGSTQLTRQTSHGAAGRPSSPDLSDTEEVTGSNPVAPTIQPLTSGNAGQLHVRGRVGGLCSRMRRRSTGRAPDEVMWTGAAASNRLQLGLFRVIGIEYGSHHCVGITKIR